MNPKTIIVTFMSGIAIGWLIAVFAPGGCRSPTAVTQSDTIREISMDTAIMHTPIPTDIAIIETQEYKLPVVHAGNRACDITHSGASINIPDTVVLKNSKTTGTGAGGEPRQRQDSVAVQVPITQKHYKDSTYEAWVSGFAQRLDSIRVYQRRETVTIREYKPPNRWALGITAGYAYTPRGFQPYIGIGISYSIITF